MKGSKVLLLAGISSVLACSFFAGAVYAEEKFRLEGDVKAQVIGEENKDLGTGDEEYTQTESLEAKIKMNVSPAEDVRLYWEGRFVKAYGDQESFETETGVTDTQGDFAEWRQSWIGFDNLFGRAPLSLRAGRQRIAEPYSLWWNRDYDAARVLYESTLLNGFLGVGQNLASYRTTRDDFEEDNEDILRVMAEASWQWKYQQFFETRLMYQDDYSGLEETGNLVDADDFDPEDFDLFWAGVRFKGSEFNPLSKQNDFGYKLDLLGVAGEVETISTAGTGNPDFRSVTGQDDRDVLGWAFDGRFTVPLQMICEPRMIFGYAYGSGDDDPADNTDNMFHQTGLDSNYSRPATAATSLHNYGSVLRPDLSNLHVISAGLGLPVFDASDLTFFYHHYRLDEDATSLETSGVDAALNGTDKDVGDALDIMMNVNLTDEFGLETGRIRKVDFRTSLGMFQAGDAFGPAGDDETAYRGLMEIRLRF